ncbi:replication protein A 70 kDa DNA-binding subunit B-like [Abeliophyllum distichum]|uniref:Replication protein A 70 kDa DNA-binding subunit B-like n=1 Tax=Abeliophyllum distichum TaxID=126358 RepID=A0ABD1QX91_9LAMI
MGDKFQLIHDVSPGTAGWTVKVVVAEKFSPRVGQRSQTKYQNLILMDSEGSTVQATLYGQNITAFQDELILGKTYLISNALVKETNVEYKAKSGEMQWTISGRTRIRRVEENNSNLLISTYSFTDFEDLPKYMDSNVDIRRASVKVLNQTYWYMSCNNCNKISSENYGDIYPCVFCKCIDAKAIPRAKVYMQLTDPTGYINATAIGNPAKYFLQSNAEILMNQTLIPSAESMRLSMDEDEIFYVKAIAQESSPDCKFEILFIVNPSQIGGDKNKGKAPVEHIGEPIRLLEPTTKRSLFHSDTDDAQSSKKKCDKSRIESTKKNQ